MAEQLEGSPHNSRWFEWPDSGDSAPAGQEDLQESSGRRKPMTPGAQDVLRALNELTDRDTTVRRITRFLMRRKRVAEIEFGLFRRQVERALRELHSAGLVREVIDAWRPVAGAGQT